MIFLLELDFVLLEPVNNPLMLLPLQTPIFLLFRAVLQGLLFSIFGHLDDIFELVDNQSLFFVLEREFLEGKLLGGESCHLSRDFGRVFLDLPLQPPDLSFQTLDFILPIIADNANFVKVLLLILIFVI